MRDIEVLSDTKSLSEVRTLVSQFLLEEGLAKPQIVDEVKLAVDEALTNIIEHAYQFRKGRKIDIQLKLNRDRLTVILHDQGRSFAWEEVPEPDPKRYMMEGREDGWGVFLMKRLMDEITYRPKEGEYNEMIMRKYLKRG